MNTSEKKNFAVNSRVLAGTIALASLQAAALVLQPPADDTFEASVLHVASADAHGVVAIDPISGQADPQLITGLSDPSGLTFGVDGMLLVSDGLSGLVTSFDIDGLIDAQIGGVGGLGSPAGLELGPGGSLLVASEDGSSLLHLSGDGTLLNTITGGDGNGPVLLAPSDVGVTHSGHFVVSSASANTILEYDASGAFVRSIGGDAALDGPAGMAFARDGRLFVASSGNDRVIVFAPDGSFETEFLSDEFDHPIDVAFGPDALLYVASRDNDRIVVLDPQTGQLARSLALGANGSPQSIAFAPYTSDAKLKSSLQESQGDDDNFKDKAFFTLDLGSGRMTFVLEDAESPIVVAYGSTTFVFHSLMAFDDEAKKRQLHGLQLDEAAFASLLFDADGKVNKNNGIFEMKKGKGDLILAGPGGLLSASIKTSK